MLVNNEHTFWVYHLSEGKTDVPPTLAWFSLEEIARWTIVWSKDTGHLLFMEDPLGPKETTYSKKLFERFLSIWSTRCGTLNDRLFRNQLQKMIFKTSFLLNRFGAVLRKNNLRTMIFKRNSLKIVHWITFFPCTGRIGQMEKGSLNEFYQKVQFFFSTGRGLHIDLPKDDQLNPIFRCFSERNIFGDFVRFSSHKNELLP